MKYIIEKEKVNINPVEFMRRAGYYHIHDKKTNKDSFTRRLGRDHYPRMHMYVDQFRSRKTGEELMAFNLHIDQKKPSYRGSHRHNAEYEGHIVESEIVRVKELLKDSLTDAGRLTGEATETKVQKGKKEFKRNAEAQGGAGILSKLTSIFKK